MIVPFGVGNLTYTSLDIVPSLNSLQLYLSVDWMFLARALSDIPSHAIAISFIFLKSNLD